MGTTLATLRSNLKTQIVAQLSSDGVTGVSVFEFPPGDDAPQTDLVYFGDVTVDQDHLTMGGPGVEKRNEILSVDGFVFARKPGAGDTIAATAEDRALTIFASIEKKLRADPTISSAVFHAELGTVESRPGVDTEGRFTILEFTITAQSHL